MIERTDLEWKHQAIVSLIGGAFSVSEDSVKYHDGQTPPSDADIDAEITRLKAEWNATQYQRDRQYPSIGDQLDMQYHDQLDGTTTWKDAIAKVKADNPTEAE